MKYRKYIFVILFLIFYNLNTVHADVGDTDGFGGGDNSSSSSNFWNSGSDDTTTSDYNRNSSFYGVSPAGLAAVVVIILARYHQLYKERNVVKESDYHTEDIYEETPTYNLKKADPDFEVTKFKKEVALLYNILQHSWQDKKWQILRQIETDKLFTTHKLQIDEYISKGHTNVLLQQEVRDVTIAEYYVHDDSDVLAVRVNASCIDYIIRDSNKRVISGKKKKIHKRAYRLVFVRRAGLKSMDSNQYIHKSKCPNCGEAMNLNLMGECNHCNTKITDGSYGWLLSEYEVWPW